MALQQNIKYKGINIDNAYIKVVHIDGNKNTVMFNVEYYATKDVADTDIKNENYLFISKMYSIIPDLISELNLWQQMYTYLKTLPEFESATDC